MFQLNPRADFNMLVLLALFSDSVSSPAFSPCSLKLSTSLKQDPTESLLKADGKFFYLCYPIAFLLHPPSLLISSLPAHFPCGQPFPCPNFILTGTHTKPGLRGLTLVPSLFSLFWGVGWASGNRDFSEPWFPCRELHIGLLNSSQIYVEQFSQFNVLQLVNIFWRCRYGGTLGVLSRVFFLSSTWWDSWLYKPLEQRCFPLRFVVISRYLLRGD